MEISDKLDSIVELLKYVQCNIDRIEQKINIVEQNINIMDKKIDGLTSKTGHVEQDCQQMRNHIDFIEDTYSKVRDPLNFFTNKINSLISSDHSELPRLENKN